MGEQVGKGEICPSASPPLCLEGSQFLLTDQAAGPSEGANTLVSRKLHSSILLSNASHYRPTEHFPRGIFRRQKEAGMLALALSKAGGRTELRAGGPRSPHVAHARLGTDPRLPAQPSSFPSAGES